MTGAHVALPSSDDSVRYRPYAWICEAPGTGMR